VPDERMLPEESIRFFYIDKNWTRNLQDGACSTASFLRNDLCMEDSPVLTGFLLRSFLVEAWPGLKVKGYDENNGELNKKRTGTLSNSILLCIFEGKLSCLRIQKPGEGIHFEVNADTCKFKNKNSNVIDFESFNCKSHEFAKKRITIGEEVVFKIGD
jgi:hypothetical protein